MDTEQISNLPAQCPVCGGDLVVTRLECAQCATEVNGAFRLSQLANLREPHAALLEMFLRVRGNVKEMERELGLSYPTVRARLEEALEAAGFARESRGAGDDDRPGTTWEARFEADLAERIRATVEERLSGLHRGFARMDREQDMADRRQEAADRRQAILDRLESGEIAAAEAATLLRELKQRRS